MQQQLPGEKFFDSACLDLTKVFTSERGARCMSLSHWYSCCCCALLLTLLVFYISQWELNVSFEWNQVMQLKSKTIRKRNLCKFLFWLILASALCYSLCSNLELFLFYSWIKWCSRMYASFHLLIFIRQFVFPHRTNPIQSVNKLLQAMSASQLVITCCISPSGIIIALGWN